MQPRMNDYDKLWFLHDIVPLLIGMLFAVGGTVTGKFIGEKMVCK